MVGPRFREARHCRSRLAFLRFGEFVQMSARAYRVRGNPMSHLFAGFRHYR
jgi:hypothetical protein